MALTVPFSTEYGIDIVDAYARIEHVSIPAKDTLSFVVSYYVKQGVPAIARSSYSCVNDLNGPNPIQPAYLHLKTLPEFSDAVDC